MSIFRTQLNWGAVERKAPTGRCKCVHKYTWDRYDRLFTLAAKNGVRLLPSMTGSPGWATKDARWVPTQGRSGYKKYKRQAYYDFVKAAAARYGSKGRFWKGKRFARSSVRARYWQVWNEPNLPNYWWNEKNGSTMASQYAQLLKGTAAALKAGDSSARAVTGGVPWSRFAAIQPPNFLKKLFSISGTAAAADFVAIHPYAANPDGVVENVRLIRRTLNGTSARSRPIWLTEFGWASSGSSSKYKVPGSTQARRERTQASYLRETYRKLLAVKGDYRIQGALWFNLLDVGGSAWYYNTGLFRKNGSTSKIAWKAMRCVTTGACRY